MFKNREFPGTLSFKKPMTNFYWPFLFSYVFIITHWKKKKMLQEDVFTSWFAVFPRVLGLASSISLEEHDTME